MAQFVCSRCGKTAPLTTRASHCACGGLFSLDFTPPPFSLELGRSERVEHLSLPQILSGWQNDLWRGLPSERG